MTDLAARTINEVQVQPAIAFVDKKGPKDWVAHRRIELLPDGRSVAECSDVKERKIAKEGKPGKAREIDRAITIPDEHRHLYRPCNVCWNPAVPYLDGRRD